MVNWAAIALLAFAGGLFLCILDRDRKIKELRKENEELKKKIVGNMTKR